MDRWYTKVGGVQGEDHGGVEDDSSMASRFVVVTA